MRSLDSARKLAPLGMTEGDGKLAPLGMTGEAERLRTVDGLEAGPRLAVREDAAPYEPTNGTSEPHNPREDDELVDPMALPEPTDQLTSPSPAHGGGGWGVGAPPGGVTAAVPGEISSQVAARLLAEILALDLGNLTPIRALTLLHELQTAAREAVPWTDWMASLAGARDRSQGR